MATALKFDSDTGGPRSFIQHFKRPRHKSDPPEADQDRRYAAPLVTAAYTKQFLPRDSPASIASFLWGRPNHDDLRNHLSKLNMPLAETRIAIVTNVLPSYRLDFYKSLIDQFGKGLTVFCQTKIPGMALNTIHDRFPHNVHLVKSITAKEEKLGWQFLPLFKLLSYDVIFIYGNPRIISNLVYALILLLLKRKVVIWGQAHTAGSKPLLKRIRLLWWRCFRYFFVYTDNESKWLARNGFCNKIIVGMNNGLDQRKIDRIRKQWPKQKLIQWQQENKINGRPLLVSCARLVAKNHFEECIELLSRMQNEDYDVAWVVIGDGPQRYHLKQLSESCGVADRIIWLGPVYKEEELAPWFLSADLFLHPAAIGLSLLHAMGYGLPVVTQDDASGHMPEFAAFRNGETGLLYTSGDMSDLHNKVRSLIDDHPKRCQMGSNAERIARMLYNKEVMVDRFNRMMIMTTRKAPAL